MKDVIKELKKVGLIINIEEVNNAYTMIKVVDKIGDVYFIVHHHGKKYYEFTSVFFTMDSITTKLTKAQILRRLV